MGEQQRIKDFILSNFLFTNDRQCDKQRCLPYRTGRDRLDGNP